MRVSSLLSYRYLPPLKVIDAILGETLVIEVPPEYSPKPFPIGRFVRFPSIFSIVNSFFPPPFTFSEVDGEGGSKRIRRRQISVKAVTLLALPRLRSQGWRRERKGDFLSFLFFIPIPLRD